jgi:hypothetical protein
MHAYRCRPDGSGVQRRSRHDEPWENLGYRVDPAAYTPKGALGTLLAVEVRDALLADQEKAKRAYEAKLAARKRVAEAARIFPRDDFTAVSASGGASAAPNEGEPK